MLIKRLNHHSIKRIRKYLNNSGADYIFDMVGNIETFDMSLKLLKIVYQEKNLVGQ